MADVDDTLADAGGQATATRRDVHRAYRQVLEGAATRSCLRATPAGRVHLLEAGNGAPVVMLHGTGNPAGFFLPLLNQIRGARAIAPDLPGIGLSDPVELPWRTYRTHTVAWLDGLFDSLGLDTVSLLGHSGGGVWALWYALARPHRVERLVLVATPTLPNTRCPLPLRLIGTPGVRKLLDRLSPPSRLSVLKFAELVGEKETLCSYPDLVDLLVAVRRDPIANHAAKNEFRAMISPFALLSPSGFRHRSRVRTQELRSLAMPTLVLWGDRDPIGSATVAEEIADLIPHGTALVLPAGHGPFLGHPARVATALEEFIA